MAESPKDHSEKIEPLWQSVVGDTEPWRRGRVFLILLGIITFCIQCLSIWLRVAYGDLQGLFVAGIYLLIFWLQFYFIWIGVHWVRWLTGAWNALAGFALIILGWSNQSTIAVLVGCYLLGVGLYLALAPAVYFFAKHQRESVRWTESIVVAGVFLLLLASLGAGVLGLAAYRTRVGRDADRFADGAFESIFARHDTYFLLDHASKQLLDAAGGRGRLTRFLQDEFLRAGDVKEIEPANGIVRLKFSFPVNIGAEADLQAEGKSEHGPIRMHLTIGEMGSDWQIDGVHWTPISSASAHHTSR